MRPLFIFCGILLALAACGEDAPMAPTYAPPAGKGGRLCIEQCGKSRDYCGYSCDLDYRACYGDMQAMAEKEYDRYARMRFDQNLPNDKFPSAFEHPEICRAAQKQCAADCDRPYNACYSSCGGKVSVP